MFNGSMVAFVWFLFHGREEGWKLRRKLDVRTRRKCCKQEMWVFVFFLTKQEVAKGLLQTGSAETAGMTEKSKLVAAFHTLAYKSFCLLIKCVRLKGCR